MRTFLIILLTALLTLIGAGVAVQEGLIPGFGGARTTTQVVKTYQEGSGSCEIKEKGKSCQTPWGTSVEHGDLVLSFKEETGTVEDGCEAKSSICNDGVFLNGDEPYEHETCALETPGYCTVNGFIFAHGTTETFYNEGVLEDGEVVCDTEERTCSDGEASGDEDYKFLSCFTKDQVGSCIVEEEVVEIEEETVVEVKPEPVKEVVTKKPVITQPKPVQFVGNKEPNCPNPWGGYRWEPGQTGTAYAAASVAYGQTCEKVSLVCAFGSIRYGSKANPGAIVGSSVAQSCKVQPPSPCSSACGTVPHGDSVTTYSEGSIPFGSGRTCQAAKVTSTCTNGVLSPGAGSACSCEIAPPLPCVAPNGQTVAHESSLTLYEFPKVQALPGDGSDTCVRQWRQCINGTFHDWNGNPSSFTFRYPTCEVIEPPVGGGPGGEGIPTQ